MELVFKPAPFVGVVALLGFPLAIVFGLGLAASVIVAVWADHSLNTILGAVAAMPLGLAVVWIGVLGIRTRHAFFTEYMITPKGVTVRSRSGYIVLPWTDLLAAQLRRVPGLLELTFRGAREKVVLMSVDMDPLRERVKAASEILEQHAHIPIQRTLL